MRYQRPLVATAALAAAGGLAFGLSTLGPAASPPATAATGLTPYTDCDDLLEYYRSNALDLVGPYGLGGGPYYPYATDDMALLSSDEASADSGAESASPSSSETGASRTYSETNVQEQGVDEPDVVKTDGEILVMSHWDGKVRILDVDSRRLLATLDLPGREESEEWGGGQPELLLDGERLVVLQQGWAAPDAELFPDDTIGGAADRAMVPAGGAVTRITTVDLSDPANPQVTGASEVDAQYRSARLIGGTIRLVTVASPDALGFLYPANGSRDGRDAAEAANRQVIQDSTVQDWLPTIRSIDTADGTRGDARPLLDCAQVSHPEQFSGLDTLGVLTLDIHSGDPTPASAAGLTGQGEVVYASADRLIVSTNQWSPQPVPLQDDASSMSMPVDPWSGRSETVLHTFDITNPASTSYVASGRVDGWLLNQFSLDEQDGVIRVATTQDPADDEESESSLVTLREEGGELVETGRLDGLGETERIYSVRYLSADLAAVVTFRETDPLYLIDTSDPTAPRTLGELKIPGYSAYLHPIGEDLLLGIGQDADPDNGMTEGLQASLFDISDPTAPERIDQLTWTGGYSQAEYDHRAVTVWGSGDATQVFLPLETWSEDESFIGVTGFGIGEGTLAEIARTSTGGEADDYTGYVSRSVVIGDTLWALTETEVVPMDLATLEAGEAVDLEIEGY